MSFSQEVARFTKGTPEKVERVRRGVVLKLFGAVILDTPVLTGRLRGNWRTNVGQPQLAVTDREDPSGAAALAEVAANVGDGKGKDITVSLSNSLPYAQRIEYGYSKKAPEGMVRRNFLRITALFKKALEEGKL